jgi:hypothetical protein
MAHQNGSNREPRESVRHAQWVREHPHIGESGFPEYPDEPARRGASRGAVPNGNPWRPVDPDERPGRDEASAEFSPDTLRTGTSHAPADPTSHGGAPHPVGAPTLRPAVVMAVTEADERVGREIGERLAHSKSLEGRHLIVEVLNGEVYLRGSMPDQATKSEVEQLCSSVSGVERIYNELDVDN